MLKRAIIVLAGIGLTLAQPGGVEAAASGWSLLPTLNQVSRHGSLEAISCADLVCVGVGKTTDGHLNPVPEAVIRNGSSWEVASIELPLGATSGDLSSVSCPVDGNCVAVGNYTAAGAESPLAGVWSAGHLYPVNPSRLTPAWFDSVSCVNATSCEAVGRADSMPLAEHWNGSSWSIQPTPGPSPTTAGELLGVDCTAVANCLAVGWNDAGLLVESWNGSAWSIIAAPVPPGAGSILNRVACASSSACMALGTQIGHFGPQDTFTATWDGSSWSAATQLPDGTLLNGIACTGASACFGAGTSFTPSPPVSAAVIESWDGSAWTALPTPLPAGTADSSMADVSCGSGGLCAAAGDFVTSVLNLNLFESLVNESWSPQVPPNPTGALPSTLVGVSCVASGSCMAVGSFSFTGPFAEAWSGGVRATLGLPSTGTGVSCTSTSFCMVVGGPLAERWSGRRWFAAPTAAPSGADTWEVTAVSCASATFCLAVGFSSTNLPFTQSALVERWDGTQWTIAPGALTFPSFSSLTAVSCSAPTFCMAVGSDGFPIAVTWNGSSVASTASRPNASAEVDAVSCSASTCMAVGFENTNNGLVTYASEWSGSWADVSTPNPSGAANARLRGVSCAAPTQCVAVGTSDDGAFHDSTLAEMWSGTTWSIQPSPDKAGAQSSDLDAVSCPSVASCTAVGSWSSDDAHTGTLGEVWSS